MDPRSILFEVKEKQNRLAEQEEYIERLRDTLGMVGITYDSDRVQSSADPDKLTNVISKIIEEEKVRDQMKQNLVLHRIRAIDMIHCLDDNRHRKILYLIYIDGLSVSQCAQNIGYSYDYLRHMQDKALIAFDRKNKTRNIR